MSVNKNEPPSVIDDVMLRQAVDEQGPHDRPGEIAREEGGVNFSDVTTLRLDYRNILEINNLWCFTSLVNLQMCNNVIEKIQGLDILVNLVYLDLSFNNISRIEGLDRLTKIEDLSLFNNQISIIENLEKQKNLRLFSVGNNDLTELKTILYLRRFKNLKSLCLSGNPFCEDQEAYYMYAVAFLPNIEYLDYFLADENLRKRGCEKHEIALMQAEENDRINQAEADKQAEEEKTFSFHKAAFVENLDGTQLFDAMWSKDADGQKFNTYKEIGDPFIVYKQKFLEHCHSIFVDGIRKHEQKSKDLEDFYLCVEAAQQEARTKSIATVDEFMEYKDRIWPEFESLTDKSEIPKMLDEYNNTLTNLLDSLLDYELNLVDQLEEVVKELQRNVDEINSVFLEFANSRFALCRNLENKNHENVMEISGFMADRAAKHEEDDEIDLELQALIVDKAAMIVLLNSSHDMHLLALDNRQDAMAKAMRQWHDRLVDELHETMEVTRNRNRVTEIYHFIDFHREDASDLAAELMARGKHVSIFLE